MTAAAAGSVEHPGRNVAAKAGLNRSILDAGWGQFTSILVAKAEIVVCPTHGELDVDLNGARNIAARAGLGSGQASAA